MKMVDYLGEAYGMVAKKGYLLSVCFCGALASVGCCGRVWCIEHGTPHSRGKHSYNKPLDARVMKELDEVLSYAMGDWDVPPAPVPPPLQHTDTCAIHYTGMCNCAYGQGLEYP